MTSAEVTELQNGKIEERPEAEFKRVACAFADFRVDQFGNVNLIDPSWARLNHTSRAGHPVVMVQGIEYWVADLVARAHLDARGGYFIEFIDGQITNVAASNLWVDTAEFQFDRIESLMKPDHLPRHKYHGIPVSSGSKSERNRTFIC